MLQSHSRQPNYRTRAILQRDPDARQLQIAICVAAESYQDVVPMWR